MRHVFTPWRSRSNLPEEVQTAVRNWAVEHEVGEVSLEPMGELYAVRLNMSADPVPGVYLPPSTLEDVQALLELLDAALEIYYDELNLNQ
ncbi:hypothetical protein [Oceanithermus sp.]|uniref:hypothetical protein n=1 Tax=Oceanithermus sp. TaxID=2268145 RepID=UPI0025F3B581|nr:hypothetical protein [Oceanithermus sp.]